MGVIFWLAADSGQNSAVPMAHLLDCLLRRSSVKDEGLARSQRRYGKAAIFVPRRAVIVFVCMKKQAVRATLDKRAYYLFFGAVLDSRASVCC